MKREEKAKAQDCRSLKALTVTSLSVRVVEALGLLLAVNAAL